MAEETTTTAAPAGPKPKKSVALSGVAAGNTALCTVGRSGNDLHYRGYDILDLAEVEAGKIDLSLAPVDVSELVTAEHVAVALNLRVRLRVSMREFVA